jgi:NitT/TauT family transport system substrate-binding protein
MRQRHSGTEKMRISPTTRLAMLILTAGLLALRPGDANAADPLRLGLLHTLSPAPFYIAQERGYFHDEGIDLTFRFFDAAQPIAAAAVSGDIDVGVTALTGGFFNLAEKGVLKVIGGGMHEQKGYEGIRRRSDLGGQAARPQLRHHAIWLVVSLHAGPPRRG